MADRFVPSSKTCSGDGDPKGGLDLSTRTSPCGICTVKRCGRSRSSPAQRHGRPVGPTRTHAGACFGCFTHVHLSWSLGWGLNPRPTHYECVALPLSYPGTPSRTSIAPSLGITRLPETLWSREARHDSACCTSGGNVPTCSDRVPSHRHQFVTASIGGFGRLTTHLEAVDATTPTSRSPSARGGLRPSFDEREEALVACRQPCARRHRLVPVSFSTHIDRDVPLRGSQPPRP